MNRHTATIWIGAGGTAAVAITAISAPHHAFAAWLAATLAIVAVPVGALPLLLVWHLHRGQWGRTLGPALTAAVATMPLAGAAMLPVLVFAGFVYPWGRWSDGDVAHHGIWLTAFPFLLRGLICFAVWWLLAWLVTGPRAANRGREGSTTVAVAGLIVFALTASFAGIDWVLSIQPEVYSSIFGLVFIHHLMLGGFAFVVAVSLWRAKGETPGIVGIGNMLLGGVMLWVYHEYMQYLIVWAGDLPRQTAFYLERIGGVWTAAVYLIGFGGGAVPFVALMWRRVRRSARALAFLAVWLLFIRVLEGVWWTVPLADYGILDALLLFAAIAGAWCLWVAFWYRQFTVRRAVTAPGRPEGAHG